MAKRLRLLMEETAPISVPSGATSKQSRELGDQTSGVLDADTRSVHDDPGLCHVKRAGLALLVEASRYAGSLDCDIWDFAVEIDRLEDAGLSCNDLRWLLRMGYVSHASESKRVRVDGRVFLPLADFILTPVTCFVLTDEGKKFASLILVTEPARGFDSAIAVVAHVVQIPMWDRRRRHLDLGSLVVKHFKVPARNQELILDAFHEQEWAHDIDDPLPPERDQDSKHRLHTTIGRLNRHQTNRLIGFHGDGTGRGIRWDLL